jgi:hypothetical protein
MRIQGFLFILLAVAFLITPVFATMTTTFGSSDTVVVNRTDVMNENRGTPISLWILSIIATLALILISYLKFPNGEEGLVGVMAIFPSAFAYLTAFDVDQITVTGITAASGTYHIIEKHTIYHFDDLAHFILLPLLVWTIINVFRIYFNYKKITDASKFEEKSDS